MINSHALPKGPKKSSEILGPMSFEDLQVELEKDVIEGAGETVQVRLSMIDEIRDRLHIDSKSLQPKPAPFTEISRRYWQSHDENSSSDAEKLATFTLGMEMLSADEEAELEVGF
ncbi:hypothetical protein HN512_04020 [Candidatus Peregrinibacteria bacterium]|jgi:hypothetical protein|nr:hypothetical protein [Candidatus Peregrinibacteria bacterium]MBT3598976.1 hypothetical protein [Candidatus Peregrinibacteria bacterium]MBT4367634.1 hypothetical protein [Candidatus Peregrinibacteria bacterium]MBT4585498.1 hypothetical protein [Candidatus Peregrinibacteria bacterium]MBT6731313.1 hypothetical protein [Candidatus Peregrinibacteria bacterium]